MPYPAQVFIKMDQIPCETPLFQIEGSWRGFLYDFVQLSRMGLTKCKHQTIILRPIHMLASVRVQVVIHFYIMLQKQIIFAIIIFI